ncbi:hypothetical protein [Lewinella cohaerens]|uniref:hypothetical protein n=1 Tax=Lewinella cohaerens TaxID=70995 RepID=UPI00035EF685|nr:hypothetical protein [Lewinella cohaerens]
MSSNYFDFRLFRFSEPEKAALVWQGTGKSGILIIYNHSELAAEDRTFLENILKAVKLSPVADHVFLLGCPPGEHWPLSSICRDHAITTVYIFGTPPAQLGIRAELPLYSFTRLGDLSLLRAHALNTIREEREQNKNEKAGLLWQALKAKYL